MSSEVEGKSAPTEDSTEDSTEGGNERGEGEDRFEPIPDGGPPTKNSPVTVLEGESDLLKMLEEQNRILESDSRYHQVINNSPTKHSAAEPEKKEMTKKEKKEKKKDKAAAKKEKKENEKREKKEKKDKKMEDEKEKLPNSVTTPVEATPSITSVDDRLSYSDSGSEVNSVASPANEEERILIVWSDVMKNWEEISKKNFKFIRTLVLRGIPGPMRGMAWQLLAGSQSMSLKSHYPSLITESTPFEKSIQRDLARTFPEHPLFKEKDGIGQESLLNLTKAYSVYDPEVGYCQGSLFIAGILLMNMPEEEAFCVFVHMMNHYRLRELYKPTMADLSVRFYQLENLVEELFPRLDIHFRALGFHTSMYSSSWFLTLFASTLPLCASFRILDIFLIDGIEVIFRVGLTLLERSQNELLKLDMEDMTKHFQKEMKCLSEKDCDVLFEASLRVKVSSKKLKKLEKEYNQKKERQQVENSELTRLQEDNYELEKRVIALEKECASLADRLIQGQVTRAQEYEEMYGVRRELTSLRKKVATFEKKEKSNNNNQKSRSNTPEVHPTKFLSPLNSTQFRDRSISAPSLRDTPPSVSSSLASMGEGIKEEGEEETQVTQVSPGEASTMIPEATPVDLPPPLSPSPDAESLLRELAVVKIERAECADLLDRKLLELRKLNQKYEAVENELIAARETITRLQREKVCLKCGSNLEAVDGVTPIESSIVNDSSKQAVTMVTIEDLELQFNEVLANLENVITSSLVDGEGEGGREEERGEEEVVGERQSVTSKPINNETS